jgi:hypothetical protein
MQGGRDLYIQSLEFHSSRDLAYLYCGCAFHFLQLPLHNTQLTPKNPTSYDANDDKGEGEPAHVGRPAGYRKFIMLVLSTMAASASVFVAFKGAEYADDEGWPIGGWLVFVTFLVLALWLAAHLIPTSLLS